MPIIVSQRPGAGSGALGVWLSGEAIMRVLILGGTAQASALAARLSRDTRFDPILSLAGRTKSPVLPQIRNRVGGFGGFQGLANFLREEAIDAVIDATHPFAEQISANAAAAAKLVQVPVAVFSRAAWTSQPGDRWRSFVDAKSAAFGIGNTPRRVFLTVGRLQLPAFDAAPQHDYLIRTIDPPDPRPNLPRFEVLLARGPFSFDDELNLMRKAEIEVVVTKNSGGDATRAKLDAARALGLEVMLIRRPQGIDAPSFETLDETIAFLERHLHRPVP